MINEKFFEELNIACEKMLDDYMQAIWASVFMLTVDYDDFTTEHRN